MSASPSPIAPTAADAHVATAPAPALSGPPLTSSAIAINLVIAAMLMLATLPGRTQGLGLITEPLLADVGLDKVKYADLNLWATLGGGLLCLPVGFLIDRLGLRAVAVALLLGLGVTVWRLAEIGSGYWTLFTLILLTRAFGQSGLSVVSISAASAAAQRRYGMMMGIYGVVLTVFFFAAFGALKATIPVYGWRTNWLWIAGILIVVMAPIILLFLRASPRVAAGWAPATAPSAAVAPPPGGRTLSQALATPTFWVFAVAVSLYGLVSSGLGLFAQAVLSERGLEPSAMFDFYQYGGIALLAGQGLCTLLAMRFPLNRLLTVAMVAYAAALALMPLISGLGLFYVFTALSGLSGGIIAVLFYAVWKPAFGTLQLGRIQGAAQLLTVVFSALGPEVLERCHVLTGSYTPVLSVLAVAVTVLGIVAWRVRLPTMA